MMNYTIIIGVERYNDKSIPPVAYAEADATSIAAALDGLGFDAADRHLLLSQKATKATIESLVDRVAKLLSEGDTLFFFYAGHGFSGTGENYLTCSDTQLSDLTRTSVQLRPLFEALRASKAKRVAFFLDACQSGMKPDPSMRGIFTHLSPTEIEDFFRASEFYACFSSCKGDEKSYSAGVLNHGIWTHHLIEALTGNAALAMEQGLVTSQTLQNYLVSVPEPISAGFCRDG